MGASEIESFMAKYYETCIACNDLKSDVSAILDHCLEYFSNNPYIIDYKKTHSCTRMHSQFAGT